MLHPVQLVGELGVFRPVVRRLRKPTVAQFLAAFADAVTEVIVDAVGVRKLGVLRPTVISFGLADFFFT